MKLQDRANLILSYMKEKGPQFGPELCERFKISGQVLLNTIKPLRKSGLVAVDKIRRPGACGGSMNRFRLAGDDSVGDAQIVIRTQAKDGQAQSIFGKHNPADPFGLATARHDGATQNVSMVFCCSLQPGGNLVLFRGAGQSMTELDRFEVQQLKQFLSCAQI